jgi:hypothetical protein
LKRLLECVYETNNQVHREASNSVRREVDLTLNATGVLKIKHSTPHSRLFGALLMGLTGDAHAFLVLNRRFFWLHTPQS